MAYSSNRRSFDRPDMKKNRDNFLVGFIKKHKKIIIKSGLFIFALIMIAQLIYPADYMLPFQKVDGVDYSGKTKDIVINDLDEKYRNLKADFYVNGSNSIYKSVDLVDIGFGQISNKTRIENYSYPWYLRIVPLSVLWANWFVHVKDAPEYTKNTEVLNDFILTNFTESCHIDAVDASLSSNDSGITVLTASNGGQCSSTDIYDSIYNSDIRIDNAKINISSSGNVPPRVATATATLLADKLTKLIDGGIKIKSGNDEYRIPSKSVYTWLSFSIQDSNIIYKIDDVKAKDYMKDNLSKKVYKSEETTTIETMDYIEKSRTTGKDGQEIDVDKTFESILKVLNGDSDKAEISTKSIPAKIVYNKTDISTNPAIQSVVQNYVSSHGGNYAVYFQELAGGYRKAVFNQNTTFTTASTYKLFVAYSTLLQIESEQMKWSDYVAGQSISSCFDDMISLSDNACAEGLLNRIGRNVVTADAHSIGSNVTYFNNSGMDSTANDLALLLIKLQTGQILKDQSSRDKMIAAMKSNVYVLGIPSGTSGNVANKVGFLDNLLNDAAIVYDSKDTYVLVIITENSSWGNIAGLTREIENAR
jgi:beta-lactamase class A